jgi:hypothetical protein
MIFLLFLCDIIAFLDPNPGPLAQKTRFATLVFMSSTCKIVLQTTTPLTA